MRPFTEDFRERIVAAYEAGGVSLAATGRRFGVSGKVVGKFVRQKRSLGTLAPQVHRRGRKAAVCGKKKEELRASGTIPGCDGAGTARSVGAEVFGKDALADVTQDGLAF